MPLLGHPDTTVRRAYEVDQKKYDYHLITLDSLGSLSLLLYPTVSDYWNSLHQREQLPHMHRQLPK